MVVGGAAAFRADARMWLAMRDNPGGLIRNGCGLAAQTRGLAIAGEPVALLAHAQCVCVGAHVRDRRDRECAAAAPPPGPHRDPSAPAPYCRGEPRPHDPVVPSRGAALTRDHFAREGLITFALPFAYCTVSQARPQSPPDLPPAAHSSPCRACGCGGWAPAGNPQTGYCRYAEHLALSVRLQGEGLLRRHPELCACDATPTWGWEACPTTHLPNRSTWTCITGNQTDAARAADPGFCQLSRQCLRALAAVHGED